MSKTMVKVNASENQEHLVFQTVKRGSESHRWHGKSDSFYVPLKSVFNIFSGESLTFNDIYSFMQISYNEPSDRVILKFTWLQSNGHQVKGNVEFLELEAKTFKKWLYSGCKEALRMLSLHDKVTHPKVIFTESGNRILKNIVKNPIVRKKFSKAISSYFMTGDYAVQFYSDYDNYSLGFSKYAYGKYAYNGGLILHDKEDLPKARYSVHT